MKMVEWVCLGGRGCGIQRVAQCRCSMMRGYYPEECLVIGKGKWEPAKAAATSHNKRVSARRLRRTRPASSR